MGFITDNSGARYRFSLRGSRVPVILWRSSQSPHKTSPKAKISSDGWESYLDRLCRRVCIVDSPFQDDGGKQERGATEEKVDAGEIGAG
jgi:hypothetical protein